MRPLEIYGGADREPHQKCIEGDIQIGSKIVNLAVSLINLCEDPFAFRKIFRSGTGIR